MTDFKPDQVVWWRVERWRSSVTPVQFRKYRQTPQIGGGLAVVRCLRTGMSFYAEPSRLQATRQDAENMLIE